MIHNAKQGNSLCKNTGRSVGCKKTKYQVPVVQRVDNTTIIISIQYMQITELPVSLILINWDVLDGTSYLLKNWVYTYKCHLKHLEIVMAFYNKVSMLITPATCTLFLETTFFTSTLNLS